MHRRFSFIALLLSLIALSASAQQAETFAQCVTRNGGVMYSAWWCPYCFAQLREFDPTLARSQMRSPEKMSTFPFAKDCGGKDPGTIRKDCLPAHARGVPMWTFTKDPIDPTEYTGGGLDLDEIAERTGCVAPNPALKK